MPELPEVETFKRDLDANALDQPIKTVCVGVPRLLHGITPQGLGRRLHGRALDSTRRHGKHLFARVGDAGWLVLHFGMSGRLQYAKAPDPLPQDAQLLLLFENKAGLAYIAPRKLGRIDWTGEPDDYIAARGLGPDALAIDGATFRDLARGRRGGVKSWLMDQGSLAGIGNIYADEILFQARIRPARAVTELDDDTLQVLYEVLHRVLRQAIRARADPLAMPRDFLLSHRRACGRCPRCGGSLATTRIDGRTAYYCPSCQPG